MMKYACTDPDLFEDQKIDYDEDRSYPACSMMICLNLISDNFNL